MTYLVNKTDGTAIPILDGTSNVTATSLTLIGKLATNYGEKQNENFVWLLENFAYTSPPAYPIRGQLWYDTSTQNIKFFDDSTWKAVGSNIVGNVSLTGNLFIGPNNLQIQDLGNVTITNSYNLGNIRFVNNIGGTLTNTLVINGNTGLITVSGNATNNFGVVTKIYSDVQNQQLNDNLTTSMTSNVAAANTAIVTANVNMKSYVDNISNLLYANAASQTQKIDAANAAIVTANVNLKSYVDDKITTANTSVGNYAKDYADSLNLAMVANITATNASIITANVGMKAYVDAGYTVLNTGLGGLNDKAPIASPVLTGTPRAPTASSGTNTTQIATTAYVMERSQYWDGSKKFVSTQDPSSSNGDDGDIWFKYS